MGVFFFFFFCFYIWQPYARDSTLDLMLCHHFEILNNFWTWNPEFSFGTGSQSREGPFFTKSHLEHSGPRAQWWKESDLQQLCCVSKLS